MDRVAARLVQSCGEVTAECLEISAREGHAIWATKICNSVIATALLCLLLLPNCIEEGENSLGQPKQLTESLKAVNL